MQVRSLRSASPLWRALLGHLRTLVLALLGAALAVWIHLPLPWFTGPLLAIGAVNMSGVRVESLPFAREGGQWIIGVALGLYFTPEIVRVLVRLAPWIGAAVMFAVLLGLVGGWVLRKLTGDIARKRMAHFLFDDWLQVPAHVRQTLGDELCDAAAGVRNPTLHK